MPSPWAAFTSAPSRNNERTVSISPRMAASATGGGAGGVGGADEAAEAVEAAAMKAVRANAPIFMFCFRTPLRS